MYIRVQRFFFFIQFRLGSPVVNLKKQKQKSLSAYQKTRIGTLNTEKKKKRHTLMYIQCVHLGENLNVHIM